MIVHSKIGVKIHSIPRNHMSSKTETKSTVDGNQLAETESLSTSLSQPKCRNNDVNFKLNATVVLRDNKITACFKFCVMPKC